MNIGQYSDLVPRDLEANLQFRKKLLKETSGDPKAQEEVWIMCSRDPLFYIDSFVWTFNPKNEAPVVPWICYEFQREAFTTIFESLGNQDIVVEKSRDMGASWMFLIAFEWAWHFRSDQSFLMVSRNEDYVDKPGNMKALFQRVDFIHKHLPGWLMPDYSRTKMRLTNNENGSAIDGESTTSDAGRGDRRTAMLIDEFAAFEVNDGFKVLSATRDTTDCRFFNSTYIGSGNAFYEVAQLDDVIKLRFHWTSHPLKSEGLYYEDGKPRSPWYDRQCQRAVHMREIRQELDIDPFGSDVQFFDGDDLSRLMKRDVRQPAYTGELDYDVQTLQPFGFEKRKGGRFALWTEMGVREEPPPAKYIVGADIATGTGNSNSVLSIGNADTREQVAEWVCPNIRPEEFAKLAVAVCRWFKDSSGRPAFLIPEANGPGRNFIDVVIESGFRNIFMRETEGTLRKKRSPQPGWFATKETKKTLLGDYRRALADDKLTLRSYDQVRECADYIFSKTGTIVHSGSVSDIDPSGARENHGDRPTAGALMWKGMMRYDIKKLGPLEIPLGCFEWHRRRRREKQRKLQESLL